MTRRRSKVELSFIANDGARRATFKKRKVGLLKKAEELSTLCGVDACAIICSPYDPDPVVWPDHERAKKVVDDFLDLPDMDRDRKMLDHPNFLYQRVLKSNQQLARLQNINFQTEMTLMMYGIVAGERSLDDLSPVVLNTLLLMIDQNVGDIYRQLGALNAIQNRRLQVPDFLAPPRMMPPPPPVEGVGFEMGSGGLTGMQMQIDPALRSMYQKIFNRNTMPMQEMPAAQNVGFSAQPQVAGGFGFELRVGGVQMQGDAAWPMGQSFGAALRTFEPGSSSGAAAFGDGLD